MVNSKFISRKRTFGSRESAQFAVTPKVQNQQDKISINFQSENSLLREFIQTRSGSSISNTRENSEYRVSSSKPNASRKSNVISSNLPESIGANSFMSRTHSLCQIVHETNSVTFLETLVQRFRIFDSHYSSSSITFEVVVKGANSLKGRSLQSWEATITLTTDASKIGFGGFIEKFFNQGSGQRTNHFISITWN